MKIKRIIALGVAGCFLFASTAWAAPIAEVKELPAEKVIAEKAGLEGVQVTSENITYAENNLELAISYPVISGLTDASFQEELNYFIEKQVTKAQDDIELQLQEYVEMAEQGDFEIRPHQLLIEYDVKANNDDFLSFTMTYYTYTGGANGITVVNAFNINKKTNNAFHLKDLFKAEADYKEVINAEIAGLIAEESENFFEGEMGFQGISDEQAFYLKDDEVVIIFGKYEIAPGAMGIPEFEISLTALEDILKDDINEVAIDTELVLDLKLTKIDGVDVIPLRQVAEKLGYIVEWNANDQSIMLTRGEATVKLKIADKTYIANHKIPYILEAAPLIVDGSTYVPLSFLEEILMVNEK